MLIKKQVNIFIIMALAWLFLPTYFTVTSSVQNILVNDLYIAQIDLPKSLAEEILLLSEKIKYSWPDTYYYRETIDFGKVFHELEKNNIVERPIPLFVKEVRKQLFEIFKNQLPKNDCPEDYDNCIITIYQPGYGIDAHIDQNLEWAKVKEGRHYYFGESIIGLIIEPDTLQSLFFENPKIGEASRFYLEEKVGTAFLFQGSLRNEWKHGVPPVEKRRISMTFRKVLKYIK